MTIFMSNFSFQNTGYLQWNLFDLKRPPLPPSGVSPKIHPNCYGMTTLNNWHPGFPDTNVEMDLVVEHWNEVLKHRLAALGGRYTEESIERVGASLNLASLLESKLYPTYTERLGYFQSNFLFFSLRLIQLYLNTVVKQLQDVQPWETQKLIFGTRLLMELPWQRFFYLTLLHSNFVTKILVKSFPGCFQLQPHQKSHWRIQEKGCHQQKGVEALQQKNGRPGALVCPRCFPNIDLNMSTIKASEMLVAPRISEYFLKF